MCVRTTATTLSTVLGLGLGIAAVAVPGHRATASNAAPTAAATTTRAAAPARDLDATVRLRPTARLAPGEVTIRLRDVAWLDVAAAERIGGLIVGELHDALTTTDLTPAMIRTAIAEAGGHPARVLVQGGVVAVSPGSERAVAGRPVAMTAVRIDAAGRTTTGSTTAFTDRTADEASGSSWRHVAAAAAMPGNDVMAVATHRLLTQLDVPADRLRIGIDEADVAWLGRPINDMRIRFLNPAESAEVRVEIRPRRDAANTRPAEGGRIAILRPQIRVERVSVAEEIQRGSRLEPGMLTTEVAWVSPRTADMAMTADEVIGLEADRRLAAGRLIGPGDIQRPLVIRRGDSMIVRAGDATMPLEITVVARENGRIGDRIAVRRAGDEMEFSVLVVAPGLGRPDAPPALGAANTPGAGRATRLARR